MAEVARFFIDNSGDHEYGAADWAAYFASFIGNGVFAQPSISLQVSPGSGLSVSVAPGKGWIGGYMYANTAALTVALAAADSSKQRIDRIVIRCDLAERNMFAAVLTGTAATLPVAPELTQDLDAGVYELCLAEVTVAPGTVSLTAANITDTRADATLCGWVAGLIDQIDATNLFAQFTAAFDAWFAGIQNVLDGDTTGNLLNLINTKASVEDYTVTLPVNGWTGTGPYTQTVPVIGMLATDTPLVDVALSETAATAQDELEAYALIGRVDTGTDSINVTCYEEQPAAALTLALKVVR